MVPSFPSVHPALRVCALGRAARQNQKSSECRFFHAASHATKRATLPRGMSVQNEASSSALVAQALMGARDAAVQEMSNVKWQKLNGKWTRRAIGTFDI
jgi:hypothetical protein